MHASLIAVAERGDALAISDARKKNIPAFHRCLPPATYASARARSGFSTKRATALMSAPTVAPSSTYPYPVSGRVGTIPIVVM